MMNASELQVGIVYVIIGLILLTSGRKLFWLFVGCVGFAIGFHYTPYLWNVPSHHLLLVIAVIMGIIGAIVAVFFQKIAIGLAGFGAGGYIAVNLLILLDFQVGQVIWLPYLLGGIIGALFLYLIFDWALIVVSSLAGASMIIQAVNINPGMKLGLYFILVITGGIIQTALFMKSPSIRRSKK